MAGRVKSPGWISHVRESHVRAQRLFTHVKSKRHVRVFVWARAQRLCLMQIKIRQCSGIRETLENATALGHFFISSHNCHKVSITHQAERFQPTSPSPPPLSTISVYPKPSDHQHQHLSSRHGPITAHQRRCRHRRNLKQTTARTQPPKLCIQWL